MSPKAIIAFDCIFPAQTGGGERVYRAIAEELIDRGWDVEYLTRGTDKSTFPAPFKVTPIWNGEIYNSAGSRTLVPALKFALALFNALFKRRDSQLILISATPVINVLFARAALAWRTKSNLVIDWLEIWPASKWRHYSGPIVGTLAWVAQSCALWLSPAATANSLETIARMPNSLKNKRPILLALASLSRDSFARTSQRAGPPTILFVGRLIPDKCVESIPIALAEVKKTFPDARAIVIGEGPELQRLMSTAKEQNVEADVTCMGRVGDDELQDWYQGATVLLNPSRREGYGLVVVEAASHGTPSIVVAGPENAATHLISPGVNGYVSKNHSALEMARNINTAIRLDEKLRESTLEWFQNMTHKESFSSAIDSLVSRAI